MSFEGSKAVIIKNISGNVVSLPNTGGTIRAGSVALTDASGGTPIGSGVISYSLWLTQQSGTVAWVGSSPFSGDGFPLYSGQRIELKVDNLSKLRGVGPASGIVLSWIGIDV